MEEPLFLAINRGVNNEIEVLWGGGLLYFIKVSREGIILANSDKNKTNSGLRGDDLAHQFFAKASINQFILNNRYFIILLRDTCVPMRRFADLRRSIRV